MACVLRLHSEGNRADEFPNATQTILKNRGRLILKRKMTKVLPANFTTDYADFN